MSAMAQFPESEVKRQIAEAKGTYSDLAVIERLEVSELIALIRASSGAQAFAAEVDRRQIEAITSLEKALGGTSRKLYWLTVVLTAYTLVLVALSATLLLQHR